MSNKNSVYKYPWGEKKRIEIRFPQASSLGKKGKSTNSSGGLHHKVESLEKDNKSSFANAAPTLAAQANYQSGYTQSMDNLLKKLEDKSEFSYDFANDDLYKQYKKSYEKNASLAGRDAMGNSSALSGGYANSYAQTVSAQAQNGILSRLNDKIPELYKLAYDKQSDEREGALDELSMLLKLDSAEYEKYKDNIEQQNYLSEEAYQRYKDSLDSVATSSGTSGAEGYGTSSSSSNAGSSVTPAMLTAQLNQQRFEYELSEAKKAEVQQRAEKLEDLYEYYSYFADNDADKGRVKEELTAYNYIGVISDSEYELLIDVLGLKDVQI